MEVVRARRDLFAGDPERLARFEREAKTLALLNHPHIAAIYGLEESGGVRALVMELVHGEDLTALIARGPTPVADVIPIARQIAEAVEAAHEQGVIHRDLKPSNIMIKDAWGPTPTRLSDGHLAPARAAPDIAGCIVKVMDFGLAKALVGEPGGRSFSSGQPAGPEGPAPTMTSPAMTAMGMILGTAAYMAPEQAKGRFVDKRADIWAFGVVLYELLTGRRAFEGEDVSTTLAAVLMRDPEWGALPDETPPALRQLIKRCLERDPKARLRDIGEARVLLTNPEAMAPPVPASATASLGGRTATPRLAWILAAIGLAAAIVAGVWAASVSRRPEADPVQVRFSVPTPDLALNLMISFAVSPDGRMLAYLGAHPTSGMTTIWVRPVAELQARMLPGTDGAGTPFWSADSRHVGFVAAGKLKRTDVTGGMPQALGDVSTAFQGGAWSADGTILIAHGPSNTNVVFARVSDRGGPITEVLQPDRSQQQLAVTSPVFLPGGRRFLYHAWSIDGARRAIFAMSLDGGPPTFVMKSASAVAFAAPGTLLYHREGVLMAQPFDPDRLQTTGDPVRLAESVLSASRGRSTRSGSHPTSGAWPCRCPTRARPDSTSGRCSTSRRSIPSGWATGRETESSCFSTSQRQPSCTPSSSARSRRSRSWPNRRRISTARTFRPTASGWCTSRMNRASTKCGPPRSPPSIAGGACRRAAAARRSGAPTAGSCST
jgi:hypothetical protein